MSLWGNASYRLFLRLSQGRASWHRRHYRPSVHVFEGAKHLWLEEEGDVLEAAPASVLAGAFGGRCNLLLSGPSVRDLAAPRRIADWDWMGVNGSPALFGEEIPRMRVYHVNDAGFIRSRFEDFLRYAACAEYTLIDFRGAFELLARLRGDAPDTQMVIFENWAWPMRAPKGLVERVTGMPMNGEVALSTDLRLGLAQAGTVAYTGAQAAWLGGYEELHIYGLDLTNAGRFYREKNAQPQMLDKAYESAILPGFELLARESAKTGFRVFNCSLPSRLPETIFPKMNPDQSLNLPSSPRSASTQEDHQCDEDTPGR